MAEKVISKLTDISDQVQTPDKLPEDRSTNVVCMISMAHSTKECSTSGLGTLTSHVGHRVAARVRVAESAQDDRLVSVDESKGEDEQRAAYSAEGHHARWDRQDTGRLRKMKAALYHETVRKLTPPSTCLNVSDTVSTVKWRQKERGSSPNSSSPTCGFSPPLSPPDAESSGIAWTAVVSPSMSFLSDMICEWGSLQTWVCGRSLCGSRSVYKVRLFSLTRSDREVPTSSAPDKARLGLTP